MSNQAAIATSPSIDETLVSILIYNYRSDSLTGCLDSIFQQRDLLNFEVIVCDDGAQDGGWEIALRYAREYDGRVSISRNAISLGKKDNRKKALQMSRGKFTVELTDAATFVAGYVRQTIEQMLADPYFEHSYVSRVKPANHFLPPQATPEREVKTHAEDHPLVSVCVYNYNYGRYLQECLESVFTQTYDNIEVCFSDNASTDDSWEIAVQLADANPRKMSLSRNRNNFGPNVNLRNCALNIRGKYILKLCSDDAIHPEFIERCVIALEKYPEAAFAMVHREILDEAGTIRHEAPFYDCSCFIPGPEQAAVYMMSSVNPSISQILYNRQKIEGKRMAGNLNDRWFGDRIADFHICCESPIIYLRDALLFNRIHDASDSSQIEESLLQCMGEYVLLQQLADVADSYTSGSKASSRLTAAQEKLSRLCLRYCVRALSIPEPRRAKRYYHLAQAIAPEIENDEVFLILTNYWTASPAEATCLLSELKAIDNLIQRQISHPAPPGHIPLDHLFVSR